MNIKYHVVRNKKVGTPSLWARPTFYSTLSYQDLAKDISHKCGYNAQVCKGVLECLPEAVMYRLLMGYHVELAPRFLKMYPKLRLSVKDTPEAEVTLHDVNALQGKGSVGSIVAQRFNKVFQSKVKWEKEG